MPSLATEIRDQLARFLAEEAPLAEFWDWLMPQTWDVDQEVDQGSTDLAYDIQLLLFEFSDDLWTEEDLKSRLRALAPDYQIVLDIVPSPQQTASSATTITGLVMGLNSPAAVQLAMVSG